MYDLTHILTANRSNILPESCVSLNVWTESSLLLLSPVLSSSLVCRLRVCVEPCRGFFLSALSCSLSDCTFDVSAACCSCPKFGSPLHDGLLVSDLRCAKTGSLQILDALTDQEHMAIRNIPLQMLSIVVDYATQNAGSTYHHPMAHPQPTRALYVGSNVLDIVSTGCRLKSEVFGTLDRRSLANSTAAVSAILIAGHQ